MNGKEKWKTVETFKLYPMAKIRKKLFEKKINKKGLYGK